MNTDTTKPEPLAAMQKVQDSATKRFQEAYERLKQWRAERREKILTEVALRRKPGILDRITSCESEEAAHLMFHEFIDSSNDVSQKTINRAIKLLATIDFPRP